MNSTKSQKTKAGIEVLLQSLLNQRTELERLFATQSKEEIRIQKILEGIKAAREKNQKKLFQIIESVTSYGCEVQRLEESMNDNELCRRFEETWPLPTVTSRKVEDLWFLESWKIFPKLSDERLTGPQRKALRNIYRLLKIARMYTVGELARKWADEIRKYHTIGDKTIELIEQFLHYYGLCLRMKFDEAAHVGSMSLHDRVFPEMEEIFTDMVPIECEELMRSLRIGKWPDNIERFGQLTLCSREDLLGLENMKPEWVELIEIKMKSFDLSLRPS